jgi:hypothetical protein
MGIKWKKSIPLFVTESRSAAAEYRLYEGAMTDDQLALIALRAFPKEYEVLAVMLRTKAINGAMC